MNTLPDTTSMLRAVLDKQDMFPLAHRALPGIAIKLVAEEIRAKASDLAFFQRLDRLVGRRDLDLVLDAVPAAVLAKAVKAADKDNPDLRSATPAWLRKRLFDLVDGGAPYQKPPKSPPRKAAKVAASGAATTGAKKAAPKAKVTDPTKARSTKAKWDGKNRDGETG